MSDLVELRRLRLVSHRLVARAPTSPLQALRHALALQGQDLTSAKWSVGARVAGSTEAEVDAAFDRGELVRSWPMRGTLHVTASEDLGWMLALLAPRVIQSTARRRAELELDERTLGRAREVAEHALEAGPRTRDEMLEAFEAKGIGTSGQRGYHLLFHLGCLGVLCFGPMQGGEQCLVSVTRWIARPRLLMGDEAWGELARRYVQSHGPVPASDLAAWAKLTVTESRRALALAGAHLEVRELDGVPHYLAPSTEPHLDSSAQLLAGFDEYVLGHRDRRAILDAAHAEAIVPGGNGVFRPTLVADGEVVGTWRRKAKKDLLTLTLTPFPDVKLRRAHRSLMTEAAERVGEFASAPVEVAWA
jgi:hypothetical protein